MYKKGFGNTKNLKSLKKFGTDIDKDLFLWKLYTKCLIKSSEVNQAVLSLAYDIISSFRVISHQPYYLVLVLTYPLVFC